MNGFNVIALNESYEIISLIRYTNLQWNRKYHESGTFSIQIPLNQYSPNIAYIYTKDRPEMGVVEQINYVDQSGYRNVQLSGYFLENELNRRVVYPKGVSNITNAPSWVNQEGNAESVAIAFFDGFKDLAVGDVNSYLGISREESKSRGNTANHERNGEYLGAKIYDILKPSGLSYHVLYDFLNSKKIFGVWGGLDRTQGQTENNPVTFSTAYGNIKNPNILLDKSRYKNACIVKNEYTESGNMTVYIRAAFNRATGETDYMDRFLFVNSGLNKSDYSTNTAYYAALDGSGLEEVAGHPETINVEFDAMEGSYTYMDDFDIGDKCNIEIPEMSLSAEARLIGCYEVIKSGKWSLTLEFGTPLIK